MAMVAHKTESIYRRYAIVDAGMLRDSAEDRSRTVSGVMGTISGTVTSDHEGTRVAASE